MSGGGGGNQPTQQMVAQTSIPEYAKPYVETMLGKGQALTDITKNPYQPYPNARISGFSPLQNQAMTAAGTLGPTDQLDMATDLAGTVGTAALGQQYSPGVFTAPLLGTQDFDYGAAQRYMSPYMQGVVDVQQREAQRQADIAGQSQQAQAVGAGAFGGSRDAIMRAEAARNLALQKGDIQTRGLQDAYMQAQQQFNTDQARSLQANQANQGTLMQAQQLGEQSRQYGAGRGLAGLQTALQSAGTLGSLGGQEYEQRKGALETQNVMGSQQQQLEQALLSQDYQDFTNQQNYPYKQLGFMSDMLRGLPLTQNAQTVYQAPPNPISQLAGMGLGAYGAYNLLKGAKGGAIKARKRKGGGVSDAALAKIRGAK